MKLTHFALIPACAGLATAALTIDWSTLDGGSGNSQGGGYTLAGTIGQPDAAAMSGGAYTLTAGFWVMPLVINDPDGPPLSIARDGAQNVRLRWPATTATGWRVQFSPDLQTWATLASTPVIDGADWSVIAPIIPGNSQLYFRLAFH